MYTTAHTTPNLHYGAKLNTFVLVCVCVIGTEWVGGIVGKMESLAFVFYLFFLLFFDNNTTCGNSGSNNGNSSKGDNNN